MALKERIHVAKQWLMWLRETQTIDSTPLAAAFCMPPELVKHMKSLLTRLVALEPIGMEPIGMESLASSSSCDLASSAISSDDVIEP